MNPNKIGVHIAGDLFSATGNAYGGGLPPASPIPGQGENAFGDNIFPILVHLFLLHTIFHFTYILH